MSGLRQYFRGARIPFAQTRATPIFTAWRQAKIRTADGIVDVPVRFRLLKGSEAAAEFAQRLILVHALARDHPSVDQLILLEHWAPERGRRREILAERILEWELEDEDSGTPIPVTPHTISLVLNLSQLFTPLWSALIEESARHDLDAMREAERLAGVTSCSEVIRWPI
jgi:hypothetical protein